MAALRSGHRALAIGLALFIALHLAHHLTILAGAQTHLAVLEVIRPLYRNPIVEPLLIAGFTLQIILGLRLAYRRGWPKRFWPRIQSASGVLIALFLIQHIGAALYTRYSTDLDTNTYWAASVAGIWPLNLYFIPYYFVGITALGWHISSRLRTGRWALALTTTLLAALIVAGFTGAFQHIDLPQAYRAYALSYTQ